jgi:hypothetical protein
MLKKKWNAQEEMKWRKVHWIKITIT